MRPFHLKLASIALVALTAASCADAPTAVEPAATTGQPNELLGSVTETLGGVVGGILDAPREARVLRRTIPLPTSLTSSRTVGFFGGTLAIPQAGMSVYVPVGAVLGSTTIRVTAPAGSAVAYEFSPHGKKFLVPLIVTQSLKGTEAEDTRNRDLFAAYFTDLSVLDLDRLVAPVTEVLELLLMEPNAARFGVRHFSGYLIATGFSDSESNSMDSSY